LEYVYTILTLSLPLNWFCSVLENKAFLHCSSYVVKKVVDTFQDQGGIRENQSHE